MYGQVAQFCPQRKQPGGKWLVEITGSCALTKRPVAYRRSSKLRELLVKAQLPVISTNHFPPGWFCILCSVSLSFAYIPYILSDAFAVTTIGIKKKTWLLAAPSIYHCVILFLVTEIFSIHRSVAIEDRKWVVPAFIQFFRAAMLVNKPKDERNRRRTGKSVADHNGLIARDFLRCRNRVFPAKRMLNCRRVSLLNGFERAVEWVIPGAHSAIITVKWYFSFSS